MFKIRFKNKKNFIIFKNLILAELLYYGTFLILALSAHWSKIYRAYFSTFSNYISFTVLEFAVLALMQLALIALVFIKTANPQENIKDLIKFGEHEHLELKTSLRWDNKTNQVNKMLERGVLKTVAAFLNSEGGRLIIGVGDDRQIGGLEADFRSLAKSNPDGFENHFNNIFTAAIGAEFRQFVKLDFYDADNKKVCLISIKPSHKPVYVRSGGSEDFFIRTGNATTPLRMSEVATYISTWWRN